MVKWSCSQLQRLMRDAQQLMISREAGANKGFAGCSIGDVAVGDRAPAAFELALHDVGDDRRAVAASAFPSFDPHTNIDVIAAGNDLAGQPAAYDRSTALDDNEPASLEVATNFIRAVEEPIVALDNRANVVGDRLACSRRKASCDTRARRPRSHPVRPRGRTPPFRRND